jgi:hypothetical protein
MRIKSKRHQNSKTKKRGLNERTRRERGKALETAVQYLTDQNSSYCPSVGVESASEGASSAREEGYGEAEEGEELEKAPGDGVAGARIARPAKADRPSLEWQPMVLHEGGGTANVVWAKKSRAVPGKEQPVHAREWLVRIQLFAERSSQSSPIPP